MRAEPTTFSSRAIDFAMPGWGGALAPIRAWPWDLTNPHKRVDNKGHNRSLDVLGSEGLQEPRAGARRAPMSFHTTDGLLMFAYGPVIPAGADASVARSKRKQIVVRSCAIVRSR